MYSIELLSRASAPMLELFLLVECLDKTLYNKRVCVGRPNSLKFFPIKAEFYVKFVGQPQCDLNSQSITDWPEFKRKYFYKCTPVQFVSP